MTSAEIMEQGRRIYTAALREGRLIPRETCEGCGTQRKSHALHGHHFAGYDGENALRVQWLCPSCHMRTHAHGSLEGWIAAIQRKLRKIEAAPQLTAAAASHAAYYRRMLAPYRVVTERPTDEQLSVAARALYEACRAAVSVDGIPAEAADVLRAALEKVQEQRTPLSEITGAAACRGEAR